MKRLEFLPLRRIHGTLPALLPLAALRSRSLILSGSQKRADQQDLSEDHWGQHIPDSRSADC